jgi:hypothetical protein
MATNDVLDMIAKSLQTMAAGIIGVFAVLAVFYLTLKLMMAQPKKNK